MASVSSGAPSASLKIRAVFEGAASRARALPRHGNATTTGTRAPGTPKEKYGLLALADSVGRGPGGARKSRSSQTKTRNGERPHSAMQIN